MGLRSIGLPPSSPFGSPQTGKLCFPDPLLVRFPLLPSPDKQKQHLLEMLFLFMERVRGIEPLSSAWKADVMSHYTIPARLHLCKNYLLRGRCNEPLYLPASGGQYRLRKAFGGAGPLSTLVGIFSSMNYLLVFADSIPVNGSACH
jgi:hypothetical protein